MASIPKRGGDGNDVLYDDSGDDLLEGGGGNDSLYFEKGNDTGLGGAGNDTFYGGNGSGSGGDDQFDGGSGDDQFQIGNSTGNTTVTGGAGNDTVINFGSSPNLIASFSKPKSNYEFTWKLDNTYGTTWVLEVKDTTVGGDGTDSLYNVQSLMFENLTFQASSGGSPQPICFARGTLIHTANQAIPVEVLATGSTLQSQAGSFVKCRWIGYQRRTPEFAQFQDYLPVKISAGALDDNLPLRDLYLSPDHAVLVDGHLVHAKALVNGKTIVQMTEWAGDIEYYHLETEAHEIIYAEGVPCETFIDNVSREQFDNYAEYQALYPNTRMMKELPLPRVKFKRQLPTMIKQRLESRITELDRQHKV